MEEDAAEVAPLRVWLATRQPVDQLLSEISPSWRSELRTLLSDSDFDVVSLAVAEHGETSVLKVDLGIERPSSQDEMQVVSRHIAGTMWPDHSFVFEARDRMDAIGGETKILRCCGGIGSHLPSCRNY
jgi:hypothetical protein